MYKSTFIIITLVISSITYLNAQFINQNDLNNQTVRNYIFLEEMYKDDYFPNAIVDKGKQILVNLCSKIELESPKSLEELYKLTHAATNQFNDLQEEFYDHDSEIETAARECIAANFIFIANAYGFSADIEELIATRDW